MTEAERTGMTTMTAPRSSSNPAFKRLSEAEANRALYIDFEGATSKPRSGRWSVSASPMTCPFDAPARTRVREGAYTQARETRTRFRRNRLGLTPNTTG